MQLFFHTGAEGELPVDYRYDLLVAVVEGLVAQYVHLLQVQQEVLAGLGGLSPWRRTGVLPGVEEDMVPLTSFVHCQCICLPEPALVPWRYFAGLASKAFLQPGAQK